jgi:hypothetical protein
MEANDPELYELRKTVTDLKRRLEGLRSYL